MQKVQTGASSETEGKDASLGTSLADTDETTGKDKAGTVGPDGVDKATQELIDEMIAEDE